MAFDTKQASYIQFRETLKTRTSQVVIWSGAGLSKPAGLPTWVELKTTLLEAINKKAENLQAEAKKKLLTLSSLAEQESDLWLAFSHIRRALGETDYPAAIRASFVNSGRTPPPDIYADFWNLGINGFITLNIDRFASRSFSEINQGAALREFDGGHIHQHVDVLRSGQPFVANLHGTIDTAESWVFTTEEFKRLTENRGLDIFLAGCFSSRTILFAGISADDQAAAGHLEKLVKAGINVRGHYWLTNRNDGQTVSWAGEAGLHQIFYTAKANDHTEIGEFFSDLRKYFPKDEDPKPIIPPVKRERNLELPSPEEIERLPANEIRALLNKEAVHILGSGAPTKLEEYSKFWNDYGEAIYRAWSVSTQQGKNLLFDYQLVRLIAGGAFGQVYEATGPDGGRVAIKILHGNIKETPDMIQSFRRGVASMKILSDRKVPGVVPYISAWEIPACTIMEYVDGPNLEELVQANQITTWQLRLKLAKALVQVIKNAHQVPERVLHRDIRPANIMLRNYYRSPDDFELVVLDFDLSWHRDASGLSVNLSQSMNGYLAPEQVDERKANFRRNALVDSYGIGMTLYFMVSNIPPIFSQQLHANWSKVLNDQIASKSCHEWLSLPRRFARLIEWSTKDSQPDRWDATKIHGEISRLSDAAEGASRVDSAELFAEELAARSKSLNPIYTWSTDNFMAQSTLTSGFDISITGDESKRVVILKITRFTTGERPYKEIGKYIRVHSLNAQSSLKKSGWSIKDTSTSHDNCVITCDVAIARLKERHAIDKLAEGVDSAVAELVFK